MSPFCWGVLGLRGGVLGLRGGVLVLLVLGGFGGRAWVLNEEPGPDTAIGYQPDIKYCPDIDIPRISIFSWK